MTVDYSSNETAKMVISVLKETLDRNLDDISQFLADNGLAINKSKTELLRLTTRQQITANDSCY